MSGNQMQVYERLALAEGGEIECKTAADIIMLADFLVRHGQGYGHTVYTAVGAIMKGREIGKPALWALQWISMIRDKPQIWGAGLRSLACERPYCGGIASGAYSGPGAAAAVSLWMKRKQAGVVSGPMVDALVADLEVRLEEVGAAAKQPSYWIGWAVTYHRTHELYFVSLFDSVDARNAGLLGGKGGMYEKWPRRMYQARAVAFLIRDTYPECMVGDMTAEEAYDEVAREPTMSVKVEKTIDSLLPAPPRPEVEAEIVEPPPIVEDLPPEMPTEEPPQETGPESMTETEIRNRITAAKQALHDLGVDPKEKLVTLSGGKAYRDMTHPEKVRLVEDVERVVGELDPIVAEGDKVPF